MRLLTSDEITLPAGGNATGVFGALGGVTGLSYGAAIGATITAPLAIIGTVFSLISLSGNELYKGLGICASIVGVGTFGGAIVVGLLGAGVGATGGYIIDHVVDNN